MLRFVLMLFGEFGLADDIVSIAPASSVIVYNKRVSLAGTFTFG